MELKKLRQTPKERRESEALKADVAKQAALIEYLAMLNGIDLAEDKEEEDTDEKHTHDDRRDLHAPE